MARNATGTYTRVSNSFSNPVAGQTIDPTNADSFFDELETEITDSLCRSGKGGMLAALCPNASDGAALGTAAAMWSDLFLASGAVINLNNGDVTITHSANGLTFAGASAGYSFDALIVPSANDGAALGTTTLSFSDIFLASGAVVNFSNGDVTVTHSSNLLTFAGASSGYTFDAQLNVNAGQIVFPATQNPSANANTLDDYEEGTWTPVLTFDTPGNLNVVYSTQTGEYTKIGRLVTVICAVETSTWTHTTASGNLRVTGLPFTPGGASRGAIAWQGVTKANYTDATIVVASALAYALVQVYGSGQNRATLSTGDMPTGGNVVIGGSLPYSI